MAKKWCELSLLEKILLIIGASERPIPKKHLKVALFLMDKIMCCEKQ